MISDWVDEYTLLSFSVQKKGKYLIDNELTAQLTYDQHYALHYLYQNTKVTATDLAQWLNVNKSAISALIRRLEEKDLVNRERTEDDRRMIYLSLSKKGKQLYEECQQKISLLVEELIHSFSEKELIQFMETYKKLNHVLDKKIAKVKGVAK